MQHVDSHYDIATIGTNYQHHSMHFQSNPEHHDSTTNATTGPPSTTSVLRSWRKKDASEKQSNNTSVSEQTNNNSTTSESQGPVARVAPHNHYPKPPPPPPPPSSAPVVPSGGDIYRYQQQYGDFSVQNPPQLPPPVKYSEIIEPMQSIEPIPPIHLQKTKEKTYMEMCSVQQNHMKPYHQEYPNYKQHYDGLKNYNHVSGFTQAQYHHAPHPYLPKESQAFPMQKEPAQYLHNYKIPSNYTRNYPPPPRDTGNEFLANLNKIAPDMAQDIINDPHLRDPQYPMYPTSIDQNRIYHQQHHQRIYQRTSPIQQNYPQRNIPQNFNQYQMNQQRISHGDHYRMYPPHQRYGQVEQIPSNISPRQYHENIMGFPPRMSPNYPPCNQIEYPQHYQPPRQMPVRQDYLPMPPSKSYNIEAHPEIPEIVPEDSLQQPKKTLKAFLENWREEFTEEVEGGDSANPDKVQILKSAGSNRGENTLYVLDAMEIPSENIPQYLHLQSIEKLPPNIKALAYNSNEDNIKQNAIVISTNLKSDETDKPPAPKDEANAYQLFQSSKDDKSQDNLYHQFHEDRPACKLLQSMANARNASLNEKPIEKPKFEKPHPNYEEGQKNLCRSLPELITDEGGDHNRNQDHLVNEYSKIVDSILEENANNKILTEKAEQPKILQQEEPRNFSDNDIKNLDITERKSVIVAENPNQAKSAKSEHDPQGTEPEKIQDNQFKQENPPAIQDLSNLEDPIDLSHHFEHLPHVKDEPKKQESAADDEDDFNIQGTKHVYTDILSFKEVLNLAGQRNPTEKLAKNEDQEAIPSQDDAASKNSASSDVIGQDDAEKENEPERPESNEEIREDNAESGLEDERTSPDQEVQFKEIDEQKEDCEENVERIVELSIPDGDDQLSDAEELVTLESEPKEPDLIQEKADKIVEEEEPIQPSSTKIDEEILELAKIEETYNPPKKIEKITPHEHLDEEHRPNSLKQEDELGSSFVLEIAKELLQINVSEDINGEKVISVTPLTKVKVITSRRDTAEPVEGAQSISAEINEETSKSVEETPTEAMIEAQTESTDTIEDAPIEEVIESYEENQIGEIQTNPVEETHTKIATTIKEAPSETVDPIEETQTKVMEAQTEIIEPVLETQTEIITRFEDAHTDIVVPMEETHIGIIETIEETQTEIIESIEPDIQTAPIYETATRIIASIEETQTEIIASIEETQTAEMVETRTQIEETQSGIIEPIEEPQTEIVEPIAETQIIEETKEIPEKEEKIEEKEGLIANDIDDIISEITITSTENVIEEIADDVEVPNEEEQQVATEGEHVITETDLYLDNEIVIGDKFESSEVEIPLDNIPNDVVSSEEHLPKEIKEDAIVSAKDRIINNNYIENLSCVELIKKEPQTTEEKIRLLHKKKLKLSKSDKHKKYLKKSSKKKRRVKFDLSPLKKSDPLANLAEKTKIFSSVVVIDKLPIDSVAKFTSNAKNNSKTMKTPISSIEFKKLKNKYKKKLELAKEKRKHLNQLNAKKSQVDIKNFLKIDKTIQRSNFKDVHKGKIENKPKIDESKDISESNTKQPTLTKDKTQTLQGPDTLSKISSLNSNLTSPNKIISPPKSILKKPTIPEPQTVIDLPKAIIPEKKIQTPKSILKKTWDHQTPTKTTPPPDRINPVKPPDNKKFLTPKSILKKSPSQFVDYQNSHCDPTSKFKHLKRNHLDNQFQLNYLENDKKRRLSLEEYNNRKKKVHSNAENFKKPHTPNSVSTIKDDKEEAMVEEVLRSLNNDVMGFEEAPIKTEEDQIKDVANIVKITEPAEQNLNSDEITATITPTNDEPNPVGTPTIAEEPQASNNDVLKTPQIIDKSTIEEKLNSLEEFLPKIAPKETPSPANCDYNNISKKLEEILSENPILSSQKFSETALIRRFLNDEILTAEELKKISQIVQYKKAMQTLKKQNCVIDANPRRRHSSEFAKSIKIDFSDFDDIRRNRSPNEAQNQAAVNKEEKSNSGGRVCYNRSISAFIEEESKRNSSIKSRNRPDYLDWSSDRKSAEEASSKTPENPDKIKLIRPALKIEYLDEDNNNGVTMKFTQTLNVNKSPEINPNQVKSSDDSKSFAVTNKHSILNIMGGSSNQSSVIKHAIENIIKVEENVESKPEQKLIEVAPPLSGAELSKESVRSGEDSIKIELEIGGNKDGSLENVVELKPLIQNSQIKSMGIQSNDPEVVQNLKKSFDKSKMIKSIMVSAKSVSADIFEKDAQSNSIQASSQNRELKGKSFKINEINELPLVPNCDSVKAECSKVSKSSNETKHSKSVSKTKAELKSFQDFPDNNSNTTKTQETKEQQQPVSPVISNITKLTALLTYYKKGIESGMDNANLKKIEEIMHRLSPNLKNLPNLPEVTAPNEYEVARDDSEATKLKLHLKKKQQNENKKRKKRFRNLYTENESDEDPNCAKAKEAKLDGKIDDLTDYSVYQRKNLAGVPKLVLKRRKSDVKNCPMQPYVKISRVETIESMVKRRKKSILVDQIDDSEK